MVWRGVNFSGGTTPPFPGCQPERGGGFFFCFFPPPPPTCPACPEPLGDPVGSLEGAAQRARRAPPVGARHAVPGATASSASLVGPRPLAPTTGGWRAPFPHSLGGGGFHPPPSGANRIWLQPLKKPFCFGGRS